MEILSLLESNTSVLYTALADRTPLPSAKALLLEVASDSQNRSTILRSTSQRLQENKLTLKSNPNVEEVFTVTYNIYKSLIAKDQITPEAFLAFVEKLDVLEKTLAEKYAFLQLHAFRYRQKTPTKLLRVSLEQLESLLTQMLAEGENHRKLLGSIKEQITQKMGESAKSALQVDFVAASGLTVSTKST